MKIHPTIFRFILIFSTGLILSCVNKTEDVEKVVDLKNRPVESTFNAEIIYSEHAEVKVNAFAPEMHRYSGEVEYNEMPKGVEVVFFDSLNNEGSTLTANYAIDKSTENIMEAKNNVVIVNEKGETLNTEHLIWDRKERRIYSEVFVKITTPDEIIMGEGFESNESFSKYKILKPKGTISREDE